MLDTIESKELKRENTKLKLENEGLKSEIQNRIYLESEMVRKTLKIFKLYGIDEREVIEVYGRTD